MIPIVLIKKCLEQIKNVDLIHLTSVFYPASIIIFIINLLFYRKPVIWSPRGELEAKALIYSSKIKKIYLFPIKLFQKSIIWHSTAPQETVSIKKIFTKSSKIIEVPNFIELPTMEPQITEHQNFLYLGRIHPKKAIDNLIKGLSLSKEFRNSHHKLLIAGSTDNEYGNELKQLCQVLNLNEKVIFLGSVIGREKEKLYRQSFFTILPSHSENFGNVVVESLAQATPVIASTGTPWEILSEYHSGYWVNNSPEALALILDKTLKINTAEYLQMRKRAYQLCLEKFDVITNIQTWVDFYSTIVQSAIRK